MPAILAEPALLSFEDFLEQYDGVHCEWVDGKVELMSPVSNLHQKIDVFLLTLINFYVVKHDLGTVYNQTFPMRLPSRRSGREPDILFVAKNREHLIHDTFVDGAGDFVVEIISPESVERDRFTKFAEYEAAGIGEYWIIDGWKKEILFYQLDETGQYQQILPEAAGVYRSKMLPGFWINVAWLWENPLPLLKASEKLRLP